MFIDQYRIIYVLYVVKYTVEGYIYVKVKRIQNNAHFTIKDTDIWIAKINQYKIF